MIPGQIAPCRRTRIGYPRRMGRTLVPSDAAERVRVSGVERFFAVIGLGLASLLGWLAWKMGMTLSAGARVEVVGYLVESPDGAYRSGARRIDAGRGLLYVLGGSPQWNRRMLVAGLVELAASTVLLAAPLSLLVHWAVARWHLP